MYELVIMTHEGVRTFKIKSLIHYLHLKKYWTKREEEWGDVIVAPGVNITNN